MKGCVIAFFVSTLKAACFDHLMRAGIFLFLWKADVIPSCFSFFFSSWKKLEEVIFIGINESFFFFYVATRGLSRSLIWCWIKNTALQWSTTDGGLNPIWITVPSSRYSVTNGGGGYLWGPSKGQSPGTKTHTPCLLFHPNLGPVLGKLNQRSEAQSSGRASSCQPGG